MIYDTFFSLDTNPSLEFTFFQFLFLCCEGEGSIRACVSVGQKGKHPLLHQSDGQMFTGTPDPDDEDDVDGDDDDNDDKGEHHLSSIRVMDR